METMTRVTSETDLEDILDMLREWVGERVQKNLRIFVKSGDIRLEMPDADLKREVWDGTLLIHFNRDFSAADLVNYIVGGVQVDEMSFIEPRTLRLWWD